MQTEKLSLIQKIINSDDEGLIEEINSLISTKDFDWFNGLNKSQQDDVLTGINQLDNGETFSHEEAKTRFGFK